MPLEAIPPGSPADRLRRTTSDLELARKGRLPNVALEDLCFHAQQAAEKAFKVVLVSLDQEFPKTHSIRRLLLILSQRMKSESSLYDLAPLTEYASATRYPGPREPVGEEEYQRALVLATRAVDWARSVLGLKQEA